MYQRVTIALIGVFVAYAAAYFGNGLAGIWSQESTTNYVKVFIFLFASAATFVGAGLWLYSMINIFSGNLRLKTLLASADTFILSSAVFGILAVPFDAGPYPWKWVNMWGVLPVLAIIPMLLVFVLQKKDNTER